MESAEENGGGIGSTGPGAANSRGGTEKHGLNRRGGGVVEGWRARLMDGLGGGEGGGRRGGGGGGEHGGAEEDQGDPEGVGEEEVEDLEPDRGEEDQVQGSGCQLSG